MNNQVTCIECPKGCRINVVVHDGSIVRIGGHSCEKGKTYAWSEITAPCRFVTTTMLTENKEVRLLPVKTNKPVPKEKIIAVVKEIQKAKVKFTVNVGDVVISDVLGLGIDVVSTRTLNFT